MPRARLLKTLRMLHLYFGVFITPALLFFALTGALQTFGLHETNRDHPDYKPAQWIVVLGQLHKKQTTIVPIRRQPPPSSGAAQVQDATHSPNPPMPPDAGRRFNPQRADSTPPSRPADQRPSDALPQPTRHPLPLRIFFLTVSIGLFVSTLTGLYMTYSYVRNKPLVNLTLVAGVITPLLLIFV